MMGWKTIEAYDEVECNIRTFQNIVEMTIFRSVVLQKLNLRKTVCIIPVEKPATTKRIHSIFYLQPISRKHSHPSPFVTLWLVFLKQKVLCYLATTVCESNNLRWSVMTGSFWLMTWHLKFRVSCFPAIFSSLC